MVERALLQYIIPDVMDPTVEEKDPYFKLNWFSRHPGNEIEENIIQLLHKLSPKGDTDLVYFATFRGTYIFIRWINEIKGGLSIVLPLFGETTSALSVSHWAAYIWEFQQIEFHSIEQLVDFHSSLSIQNEEYKPMILSPIWLKASLSGDKIKIPVESKADFLASISLIIEKLPWSIYLLEYGILEENEIEFSYHKAKGSIKIPMDNLFNQLQNPMDGFWETIHRGMTHILDFKSDERSNKMLTYIGLLLFIQDEDYDSLEALELISKYVMDLLVLSLESGVSFITSTFSKVAVEHPSYETCKRLLKVADKIQESNQTDLIKLAEGTALQIAFSLSEGKQREDIFLEVTKRSKKWGNSHLIAYIQSVTGILREDEENRKILSKIVESCEDTLRDSWDGQLCLVETFTIAEEYSKAIKTRLEASKLLADKIMRSEDIFGAIRWSLLQPINEQEIIDLTRIAFNQAMLEVPKDQIMLGQIESIVNTSLETSKLHFLFNIINLVNSPEVGLEPDEKMQLITLFEQMLSISKKLIQIAIHVQLHKFNLFVENPSIYSYDAAEDLLRSIYNSVNPSKSNAVELITHITNWIILSSTKVNRIDLVDEARMRFDLLINDEEYSRITLRDIYAKAGRIRQKIPKGQLKRNGLGVKLFNEAIELCHPFKETDFLMDILPDAKSLAVKKHAFDMYVRFTILEITLLQHLKQEWMDAFLSSTDVLVDNGAIEATRKLFDHAISQKLNQDLELKLLAKQLSYVELEPDLFTAHEIYEKRNHLISLKSGNIDKKTQDELLDHYRFGISELMSKGDLDHLTDLVIQAIKYCKNAQSGAIIEFSNILKDNFTNLLDTYRESKSTRIYKSMLKLLRKINDNFMNVDLDHTCQFSTGIIQANIELYSETKLSLYLQRIKTMIRELAEVIKDGKKNNLDITPEINEVLIYEIKLALEVIEASDPMFGNVDAVNLASHFYYNIGDTQSLFGYLNNTLSYLKREIVKSRKSSSVIAVGLLVLSEIYLKIEADIIIELCTSLQQHALRLIDVILTLPMSKNLSTYMNQLKNRMENTPQQAFQEYPFELEMMLEAIDAT